MKQHVTRGELLQAAFECMRAMHMSHEHMHTQSASGMTPARMAVLRQVCVLSNPTTKDIAQTLALTSSAVTQIINELVREKILVRKKHPTDGRVCLIAFTPVGKRRLTKLKEHFMACLTNMFDGLTDAELRTYVRLHKKMVTHTTHSS